MRRIVQDLEEEGFIRRQMIGRKNRCEASRCGILLGHTEALATDLVTA